MSIFDPLYRYHADVTAYQAIDLIPDTPGVVTISGLANVDDESVTIDLGTNIFRFYGINFTGNNQLYISSNGLITFGVADTSPHNDSYSWWNWWYSNHRIAPLWDNWVTNRNTSPDDLVLYQFQDLNGDGVADQLVIEWNGVYHYDLPENDSATFQAILALNTGDTNGDIVFNYVDLVVDGDSGDSNYNDGGSATIGIWGGEYYNQPPLLIGMNGNTSVPISSGTAIRITSVPNPVTVPPTLVKDINAVSDHSSPSELTVFNGSLFFFANNGPNGHELYKTDALGNTTLVKDIVPGSGGSSPKLLTVAGSSLYFFAYDNVNGYGLWKSDGTSDGTTLVKPVTWYAYSYNYDTTTVAGSGGKFFFREYDDTNGLELWVSDGTAAGTIRAGNLASGNEWSNPVYLTDVNGTLFFSAETSTGGRELYKSNGTSSGTVIVRDIASGAASSNPQELINLNGTLYFTADDGTNGRELWRSNGTSSGTTRVSQINAGAGSSNPQNLTVLNNTLYFFADDGVNGY